MTGSGLASSHLAAAIQDLTPGLLTKDLTPGLLTLSKSGTFPRSPRQIASGPRGLLRMRSTAHPIESRVAVHGDVSESDRLSQPARQSCIHVPRRKRRQVRE